MRHPFSSALLTSAAIIAVTPCAFAQADAGRDYRLPAQPLATSIRAVALAARVNILADGDTVRNRQAPALVGRYTVERALATILAGSGLHARATAAGLVVEPDGTGAQASGDSADELAEILVTGSRIRGAPIASPVIVLSETAIRNAGQSSLGDVVRAIPQSFGGGQQPGIGFNVPGANGVDVGGGSSINLRGLGSDATLTLLNGHRLSYSASRQSVDVSAIPLSAIDRIEIVPDGASAIYGSDAVAGVANIILKRDYRGLETRARLGTSTDGGDFTQQYGALAGLQWTTGGVALTYDYASNTAIDADQRSYARDRTPGLTLFPAITSHSALLTGHQAIGAGITLSVDALYNRRHEFSAYPLDVGGDLAALHGEAIGRSQSYAIAPSLQGTIGGWLVSLAGTVAQDRTRFRSDEYIGTTLDFSSAGCYCNSERSVELSGTGAIARLPAGDAKAAIGTGYRSNGLAFSAGAGSTQNFDRAQDSRYGYAELSIPLVAPAMAVRGIDRLVVTGAVRYEDYPGIGDVATPKFGLIYAPMPAFDLKASWGKSFRAPTLRQAFQPKGVILFRPATLGGSGFPAGSVVALVQGGRTGLKPERATSLSATIALHPPALGGAQLELSYFATRYRDRIVTPIGLQSQALSNPIYSDYVTLAPSVATVSALVANAASVINASGAAYDPATVAAIADTSNVNAGRQRIHGVDALLTYRWSTGGPDQAIDLSANASYLTSDQRISAAQATTRLAGTLFNPPRFRARGSASWQDRAFVLTGTLSYVGGVDDARTRPVSRVAAMVPFDLTARYRTSGKGIANGLDLILGVQNLFNDKPDPITGSFLDAPYDSTNYSPIGRAVSLSVAKSW